MGEESVAWAAGWGKALTQSLVTHWWVYGAKGGHKACHQDVPSILQHCLIPGYLGSLQPPIP